MKVKFKLEKVEGTNLIKYPDRPEFFHNTIITADGYIIADYAGKLSLDPPDPTDLMQDEEKRREKVKSLLKTAQLDTSNLGRALKAIMIYMGVMD